MAVEWKRSDKPARIGDRLVSGTNTMTVYMVTHIPTGCVVALNGRGTSKQTGVLAWFKHCDDGLWRNPGSDHAYELHVRHVQGLDELIERYKLSPAQLRALAEACKHDTGELSAPKQVCQALYRRGLVNLNTITVTPPENLPYGLSKPHTIIRFTLRWEGVEIGALAAEAEAV